MLVTNNRMGSGSNNYGFHKPKISLKRNLSNTVLFTITLASPFEFWSYDWLTPPLIG